MGNDGWRALLNSLCIAFLFLEWTGFGSLHFFAMQQTIDQIPPWFPNKRLIVIVTGVLEVGVGLLMLVPAARKWVALGSLLLLVLLLPAMIWIVISPSATQGMGSYSTLFRIIILPNNLLLALCSLRLAEDFGLSYVLRSKYL